MKYRKGNLRFGFDSAVYNSNQLFKLINQSKIPSKDDPKVKNQNIIQNENPEKHFITFVHQDSKTVSDVVFDIETNVNITISNLNNGFDYRKLPKNSNNIPDGILTDGVVPDVNFIEPIKLPDLILLKNITMIHLLSQLCYSIISMGLQ